jgi:hypothetical protein
MTDVINNGLLTNGENEAYLTAGPTGARVNSSTLPNGLHLWVMTVRTSSPGAANTAAQTLAQLQVRYGMTTYTGTTPSGVLIDQVGPPAGQTGNFTVRAHYAHNSTVVRVQVYGPDATAVTTTFDQILAAQLAELPANA